MTLEDTKVGIVVTVPRRAGPACIVKIYGSDLGRRWMIDGSLVIGRDDSCEVVLEMEAVSRRHCVIREAPNGRHVVEDLRSTNGTFVNNEELRGVRELRSGDHLKLGGHIFKYLDGESLENQFHEAIYRMTIVDGLTEAYNKRYLLEFLEKEMSRSLRYRRTLSLMMLDIDHFKQINDNYGHIAGDHVLREVAGLIRARVRREECFARYGGEEFALVMPEAGRENVLNFAEKIRQLVAGSTIVFEESRIPVTLSIGVAQMAPSFTDPAMFIAAADEKLYEAKRSGRNRVAG